MALREALNDEKKCAKEKNRECLAAEKFCQETERNQTENEVKERKRDTATINHIRTYRDKIVILIRLL